MNLIILIALLPIVFMFYDFEEMIFFKTWLTKNRELIKRRFPRMSTRILPHPGKLSTAAFSLAVAEEFLLLSLITYTAIWWENYSVWFAAFMAFSIYLIVHIIQWLIIRRCIPSIVTSPICLPYCFYTFNSFLSAGLMNVSQIIVWTIMGIVIMILNLVVAHKLALIFVKCQATVT